MSSALPYDTLVHWTSAVFEGCGMAPAPARHGAETLVRAEARGIATHGLIRLKTYASQLLAGSLCARPDVRIDDTSGIIHIDAGRGLGPAFGVIAVDALIGRAGTEAAVLAVIKDIGHLAALGMYALRATEAGLICLVMQATPRVMALPGARGGAIGNNPFAFSSPMPNGPPLVFDIASAAVARSRIVRAAQHGETIPEGWGIDAEGRDTTDPSAALAGAQLPMAGHKGIGIAMMVECLAGSLSGVRPPAPESPEGIGAPAAAGAFMMVINPRLGAVGDGYFAHVAEWVSEYRTASARDTRYPGEAAARREAAARKGGLVVADTTRADLDATAARLALPRLR